MQKYALRDLLADALALTIFMNIPLVKQTTKVGGDEAERRCTRRSSSAMAAKTGSNRNREEERHFFHAA